MMPNRYGEEPENDRDGRDYGTDYTTRLAINGCDLCDSDGYRGSMVCDHIDHRGAAKRGMDAIRAAMGWDR